MRKGNRVVGRGVGLGSVLLCGALTSSCDFSDGVGPVIVDVSVSIEILEANGAADTVGAPLPVRVLVTTIGDESQPLYNKRVFFLPPGEDCGMAQTGFATTGEFGVAEDTWILGDLAGTCSMEVRVLSTIDVIQAFAFLGVTVLPGQPTEGWLNPGAVLRARDSLTVSAAQYPLLDRVLNPVPWRFQVISGPAIVLGDDPGEDRARTLVATGEGSGEVGLLTAFGVFSRASFDVCRQDDERWIRLFRPEDALDVLGICP